MRRARPLSCVLVVLAAFSFAACGGNEAPKLDPIGEKVAYVNSSFELRVTASDPDGDNLKFSYGSSIPDFKRRPGVEFLQDGSSALLRFTPLPGDVGIRAFDFTVSDGEEKDQTTASVEIRYAPSSNSPVFREPLGTGTLIDLSKNDSVKLRIVVEDPDSSDVVIDQEQPVIEGAKLDQDSGLTAWWTWAPTQEQIATTDRFVLTLSADDGSNAKVLKNYLLVLRKGTKTNCPGEAPVISHTPQDANTVTGLVLDMAVSDDKGLGLEPLLYYSFDDPGEPADLTKMMQTTMMLMDGDERNGTWAADVPNPVAGQAAGSTGDVYYAFVAQDDDDATGDCDHVTQAPESGAYHMKVTNPGGEGGLGVCEVCTSDKQCGGSADNCLPLGSSGEGRCGKACTGDTDCPGQEYYCTISEWESVDGVKARQCIPTTFECGTVNPGDCTDDVHEENDTLQSVVKAPGILPGTFDAMSCPGAPSGADEDWYVFDIDADSQVTFTINGGSASDLSLQLVDQSGNVLDQSTTLGSNETVESCLTQGYYFVRVFSMDTAKNSYSLTYKSVATSCAASCDDDPDEEDDNSSTARVVSVSQSSAYKSNTNAICPWDEDWFKLTLSVGQTVYATAAFDQANDKEDLDIRFYKGTTLLTKCTETDNSACDASNGQSPDSNENFQWSITTSGTYYLVIHGWNGASNLYDLCIGLSASQCPKLP